MLVIREAQMHALRELALSNFRARFTVYLGTLLRDMDEGELSRVCDRMLGDCFKYSIEEGADIYRYAAIVLREGSSGPTPLSKDARNTLLAHGVPATGRLSRLQELLATKGSP